MSAPEHLSVTRPTLPDTTIIEDNPPSFSYSSTPVIRVVDQIESQPTGATQMAGSISELNALGDPNPDSKAATLSLRYLHRPVLCKATTFFDDMINGSEQTSSSLSPSDTLGSNPVTSLPELYRGFFDNHPELLDIDQSSSDMEMEMEMDMDMDMEVEMDDDMPAVQARVLAEMRQASMMAVNTV
ncbi:hypothetical protein BGX34_011953 [Mortierella sp. NVP85]|nr:hypothetical protein BGX34_011953 [Mortierella sp. NVP85]